MVTILQQAVVGPSATIRKQDHRVGCPRPFIQYFSSSRLHFVAVSPAPQTANMPRHV